MTSPDVTAFAPSAFAWFSQSECKHTHSWKAALCDVTSSITTSPPTNRCSRWNDAKFAFFFHKYIYQLFFECQCKTLTFNLAQLKKTIQFASNSMQVKSDKKNSGRHQNYKDKQITPTPEHATLCQDQSASVLSHWQWPTVCVRLFLDRKRNRKRVQSWTGRLAGSLLQVQRWGDRKVLWHWCSWGCVGGQGGKTAVQKWATRAWFSNKWCTTTRVVSLVCEGVRISFKAAPLPWSHLLDSSCLNTTQAPIRRRETPRYNSISAFSPSDIKGKRWVSSVAHGCDPLQAQKGKYSCVLVSAHIFVWACICACMCVWTHTISAFRESQGTCFPRGALAPVPPGRM